MGDAAQFQSMGWGTAAAAIAILLFWAVLRYWKRADAAKEELKHAEEDYKKAVDCGDADRIRIAAVRLQDARRRAGDS